MEADIIPFNVKSKDSDDVIVQKTTSFGTCEETPTLTEDSTFDVELENGIEGDRLTNMQACMHIIKASVCTGVLAMPAAIRDAGLLLGTLSIACVGIVIIHAMHMLVKSAQVLREHYSYLGGTIMLNYSQTVALVFEYATEPALRRCKWLATVLKACLIIGQVGFLGVYLIVVAENTKYMVDYFQPAYSPPLIMYQFILLVLFIPLVFIKTLAKLAAFSGTANFLALGALGVIMIFCFQNMIPVTQLPLITNINTIPVSFGVIVFAFESINVLLPIENKMQDHSAMRGPGGVLNLSMTIVLVIYIAVGFYGYLKFGPAVGDAITYSIPMVPWYYGITKPMYTISILISFALQFYVLFAVAWEKLLPRLTTQKQKFWGDTLLRIGLLAISFILATTVPHVELMISFFGALAGGAICLVFPAIVDIVIVWTDRVKTPRYILIIVKDVLILLFGFFGALIGSYVSLQKIVQSF